MTIQLTAARQLARRLAIDRAAAGRKRLADLESMRDALGSTYRMVVSQGAEERIRIAFAGAPVIDSDSGGPFLTFGRVASLAITGTLDLSSSGMPLVARVEGGSSGSEVWDALTVGITGGVGAFAVAGKSVVLPRVPVAGRGLIAAIRLRSATSEAAPSTGGGSGGSGGTVTPPPPPPASVPLQAPTITATPLSATTNRIFGSPAGSAAVAVQVNRKATSGGARTLVGTITPPATFIDDTGRTTGTPVIYDAVSVDAAGAVSSPSEERTATPQAVTARRITSVSIFNTGGANPNLIVPHGLPLAMGDLPAGSSLEYREANGTPRPTQIDQEASWPQDGSRTFVAPTVILPMDAGETRTLDVWVNTNPQSKAANVTRAQMAATSDFRIVLDQGEFGADSYSVSLNDILQNGPEFSQSTGWGANPTRGWQIVKSGPLVTEWDAWSVFRRASDNAIDRHLVGEFNVAAFGNGLFSIEACVRYDTATGSKPGSTVGPVGVPIRWFRCRLMNGNTLIKQYGGTDAPGAITTASTNVNVADSRIGLPSAQINSAGTGRAFTFTSTGALPAGVQPNRPYWVSARSWNATHDFFSLHTVPNGAGGGNYARATITSQGNGTITALPAAFVCWGGRMWICSDDRQRIWVGDNGRQGVVWTGPERVYLTQRTKAVLPFNLSTPDNGRLDDQALRTWMPGQHPTPLFPGLAGTGNGNGDERVGFISETESRALATRPLDPRVRGQALQLADWVDTTHACFNDPATGLPLNITSQPANAGVTPMPAYYGTAYPGVRFSGDTDNSSYRRGPPFQPTPFKFVNDGSYIDPGYQPWLFDAAHLPLHTYGAYLLTGRIRYWKAMVHTWHGVGCATSRSQSFNGEMPGFESVTAGFRGDHQFRGYCWVWRTVNLSRHVAPDGHPFKPFCEHEATIANATINATIKGKFMSGLQNRFKLVVIGGNTSFISFNHPMFLIVSNWQKWVGYYQSFYADAEVSEFLDVCMHSWVDSDFNPDGTAPGHLPLVDTYLGRECIRRPGDGTEMTTRKQVMDWTHSSGGGSREPARDANGQYIIEPFPYSNNWNISTGSTDYPTTWLAAFIVGEWAGDARSKKLAGRLQAYPGMSTINYTNNPRYNLTRPA